MPNSWMNVTTVYDFFLKLDQIDCLSMGLAREARITGKLVRTNKSDSLPYPFSIFLCVKMPSSSLCSKIHASDACQGTQLT